MKKRILITGINGFLGSHLAKYLQSEFEVIGLEYSVNNLFRIKDENFKIYESLPKEYEPIFRKHQFYAVIHVATVYRRKGEPLMNLINTNISLPIRLFELANKYGVELFLNTDSFFNDPKYSYSYLSDYTMSKKHSLEWLKLLANKSFTKLVNMKIFHMYGENDAPGKFIPFIIQELKNNVESIDLTLGEQTRDFIYVKDVVRAYQFILLNNTVIKNKQEFEVGTGLSCTIRELVETTKKIVNSSTILNFGALPYREGEIMKSQSDISNLIDLGWDSTFKLYDGIKNVYLNID